MVKKFNQQCAGVTHYAAHVNTVTLKRYGVDVTVLT